MIFNRTYDNGKELIVYEKNGRKFGCNVCKEVDLEKSDSCFSSFFCDESMLSTENFTDKKINESIEIYRKMTLYIQLSNICFYKCFFCINKKNEVRQVSDLNKLYRSIDYCVENDFIDKIVLTGGEPLMHKDFKNIVLHIREKHGTKISIDINTSGYSLAEHARFIKKNNIRYINVSRHHYKDPTCSAIMCADVMPINELKKHIDYIGKKKFRLSVTFTDYIKGTGDIYKFIELCKNLGVDKILFRNEYLENKNGLLLKEVIDDLMKNNHLNYIKSADFCKCLNFHINGVDVSFRKATLSKTKVGFIREFLYKEDDNLSTSWSFDDKYIIGGV